MKVTVIHLMPTLMERQLDEAAGWLLKQALEARGQTILTGADTAEIIGDGKVEGVKLKDGTLIPASLVVKIGRAHVSTPVTNAHVVCRLLLETKNMAVGFYVARYVNKTSHMELAAKRLAAIKWNKSLNTNL